MTTHTRFPALWPDITEPRVNYGGNAISEVLVPVTLSITTRTPSKWLLIDRETGDRWEQRGGRWKCVERTTGHCDCEEMT